MRVVVIGAGANIWPFHERALRSIGAEIAGVQDVDRGAAERVAAYLGCAAPLDLDGLLALEADVAVILAPHPFHADLATACLVAGRHVLVEKPIAHTAELADRMVEAAQRAERLLAVSLQQRSRAEVVTARRLIGEGAIGQLQHVRLMATWPRRRSYFRTAPWRATWRGEGGGILINQGQHDLDLVCHLAGAPVRVVGRTSSRFHGTQTEDTATALVEWADGVHGTVHVSTAEDDEPQLIELTGTAGRMRLRPGCLEVWREDVDLRTWAASPGDPYERPASSGPLVHEGGGGKHDDIYRNLAEAITSGTPLFAPGDEARTAVELANAITFSSLTGRDVSLPLDRSAYADLLGRLCAEPAVGV